MVKRIVVIGPESTGKSTLSAALAEALHTRWVPEYARAYLEGLARPYVENDLLHIAQGQLAHEDAAVMQSNRFLICDTDLYVVKVWSEASFGRCDRSILEQIAVRPYDHYLLTYIDTPWQHDPLREHPHPEERYYFYQQYRDIVMNSGIPWTDIRGDENTRLATALRSLEQLL